MRRHRTVEFIRPMLFKRSALLALVVSFGAVEALSSEKPEKKTPAAKKDLNARDKEGKTPLHHAAIDGSIETVKKLLAQGADVNAKTKIGNTALHAAAYQGNAKLIAILLKSKADVNAVNKYVETPLHMAVTRDQTEAVRLLLKGGAKPNLLNEDGETPMDWTEDKVITKLLKEHGGKKGSEVKAKKEK